MAEGEAVEAITKKVGPFPGYVWVIGVAGIGWIVYLKRKSTASATAAAAPAGADAVFPSAYGPAPGTNDSTGIQASGPMSTSTDQNTSWAKMVTDSLIASGGNPTDVSNAISNWLSGASLNPTQTAIINTVQRQYGTPPMGVLPVNNVPEASSYTGHDYAVQQGDTLDSILGKFYNEKPGSTQQQLAVARISAANGLQWDASSNQYKINPGQNLKLYSDAGSPGPTTFHWP